jgi:hypothetical protein
MVAVIAGAAMLVDGLVLLCRSDWGLLLEHAEKPTAAIAARPIATDCR